jgi:hypothetical protein
MPVIARVFPRRTNATPTDGLSFIGPPPRLALPEIDEVHISVTFTYDMRQAEWLEKQWRVVGVPVKVGGPALDDPGGMFTPGMYVKKGYTITSRGCNNHCWFCTVPKREGPLREIPITDGYNIIDSNLLQCSETHIREVFSMLQRQGRQPKFTGGLEARILKPWHCELLRAVSPAQMYFAYDTPDDYEPLIEAGKMLRASGFTTASHTLCCYVLIGYPNDTMGKAEKRLNQTIKAGFMPYAMLYRDNEGKVNPEWARFQREWLRPAIVATKMKAVEQTMGRSV